MPIKKPVTTRRGQHHKYKSFRINLVKDATLEKIDSNLLRNRPELFEKKKVTFEKKNSDPSYFQETLCTAFPSLHGSEFFLCRLTCTNASKDTKTSLVPLPPEINNAVALCDCEELNRSCLYIKLQAAPASLSLPSLPSDFSSSDDEGDASDAVCSSSPPPSPSKMITVPNLLPSNSYPFVTLSVPPPPTTHESPILTFVETTQKSDEHIQPLASQPWLTIATSDINQPLYVPLSSSNQQPFILPNHVRKENQLLDVITRAEMPSSQDTENRHPKKRKFPSDSEIFTSVGTTENDEHQIQPLASQSFETTAYGDANGSTDDVMDAMTELRNQIKTAQLPYIIPSVEGTASFDAGGQQLTTTSFTALFCDNGEILETAEQARTLDVSYSHQTSVPTYYANQPMLLDVQNNAIEVPRLQASAQQWSDVNSTYTNAPNLTWQQDNNIQTANNSMMNLIVTRNDYMTEEERQINLIRRHLDFLVDRIDPDFGLLDVMIARKDLTMAQYHQIRSMPSTVEERNQKLLNYIIDLKKADRLIAALADGRQMHLANYLISDGEYQDTYHGVWPMSENELEKLILNRQALIDGLDASYLSYNLYFKGVINKRQQEFILCKPTNSEKNEVMLEILRHGSIDHYKQTIEALKELNHNHILKVLGEYEEDREQIQVIEQQLEREKKEKEQERKEKEQERKEKEQERKEKEQERKEKEELSRELEDTKQLVRQLQDRQVSKPESEALPEKYKSDPVLDKTIKTEVKTSITGLTILGAELFVVSARCSEAEVYNSVKFSFSRRWKLKELIDPADIGSCNRNKCLYIFDLKGIWKSKEILRVDSNGKLIKKWLTEVDYVKELSVTDESNVILTTSRNSEHKLHEYSPDGQLVREINLSGADIIWPHHAMKLANGHFLVTYGYDDLPGVSVVDADGNLKKSFDGKCGSTMEYLGSPVYLAVDGNGFVMVVDQTKQRILLLDFELEFKRKLLSLESHRFPDYLRKILLDQTTNQLLVVDYQEIMIFSLPSEK